eukprot:COSAG01_NODE_1561_length_9917_cov_5.742514_11_plen_135_part_00
MTPFAVCVPCHSACCCPNTPRSWAALRGQGRPLPLRGGGTTTPDVRNFEAVYTRECAHSSFEHPVFADAADPRQKDFAGFSYSKSLGSSAASSSGTRVVSDSLTHSQLLPPRIAVTAWPRVWVKRLGLITTRTG